MSHETGTVSQMEVIAFDIIWAADYISRGEMPHGQKVLKPDAGVSYLSYVLLDSFVRL